MLSTRKRRKRRRKGKKNWAWVVVGLIGRHHNCRMHPAGQAGTFFSRPTSSGAGIFHCRAKTPSSVSIFFSSHADLRVRTLLLMSPRSIGKSLREIDSSRIKVIRLCRVKVTFPSTVANNESRVCSYISEKYPFQEYFL